jgi:hypothetical protein
VWIEADLASSLAPLSSTLPCPFVSRLPLGRATIGVGIGMSKVAAPVLIQEIAHPRLRPILGSCYQSKPPAIFFSSLRCCVSLGSVYLVSDTQLHLQSPAFAYIGTIVAALLCCKRSCTGSSSVPMAERWLGIYLSPVRIVAGLYIPGNWSWRYSSLVQILGPAMILPILWFCPESPRVGRACHMCARFCMLD